MTIKKTTKMTYEKIINGQKVIFGYEYSETEGPVNVQVNVPISITGENGPGSNGFVNLNVLVANKEGMKTAVTALINSLFTELDNVVTNYTNPEV